MTRLNAETSAAWSITALSNPFVRESVDRYSFQVSNAGPLLGKKEQAVSLRTGTSGAVYPARTSEERERLLGFIGIVEAE